MGAKNFILLIIFSKQMIGHARNALQPLFSIKWNRSIGHLTRDVHEEDSFAYIFPVPSQILP